MKLFVWNSPYHVKYGSSLVFAVAETEAEARIILENAPVCEYGHVNPTAGRPPMPLDKLGAPTRVAELPYGEWHEWSE